MAKTFNFDSDDEWDQLLKDIGPKLRDDGYDAGSWTMPPWAVERWLRQAKTPYSELSETEKDSDRAEADRFLELLHG